MKKSLSKKEYVEIFLDTKASAICDQWFGEVEPKEFQDSIQQQFDFYMESTKKYPNLYWISDFSGLHNFDFLNTPWVVSFYKKIIHSGVKKIAFITSETIYCQLDEESIVNKINKSDTLVRCFDTYQEAVQWLQS